MINDNYNTRKKLLAPYPKGKGRVTPHNGLMIDDNKSAGSYDRQRLNKITFSP